MSKLELPIAYKEFSCSMRLGNEAVDCCKVNHFCNEQGFWKITTTTRWIDCPYCCLCLILLQAALLSGEGKKDVSRCTSAKLTDRLNAALVSKCSGNCRFMTLFGVVPANSSKQGQDHSKRVRTQVYQQPTVPS